jgi:hypothetical protein
MNNKTLIWESEDRKYKVVFKNGEFKAYMDDMLWLDLAGNSLVFAMLQELVGLKQWLKNSCSIDIDENCRF